MGRRDGTESCHCCATVWLLLRVCYHLVSLNILSRVGFVHLKSVNSNGVLQPYQHLGWWKWMYRTTPYTYIIEGLLGQGKAGPSFSAEVCADAMKFSSRAL
jgi:hypothetical protein